MVFRNRISVLFWTCKPTFVNVDFQVVSVDSPLASCLFQKAIRLFELHHTVVNNRRDVHCEY